MNSKILANPAKKPAANTSCFTIGKVYSSADLYIYQVTGVVDDGGVPEKKEVSVKT